MYLRWYNYYKFNWVLFFVFSNHRKARTTATTPRTGSEPRTRTTKGFSNGPTRRRSLIPVSRVESPETRRRPRSHDVFYVFVQLLFLFLLLSWWRALQTGTKGTYTSRTTAARTLDSRTMTGSAGKTVSSWDRRTDRGTDCSSTSTATRRTRGTIATAPWKTDSCVRRNSTRPPTITVSDFVVWRPLI